MPISLKGTTSGQVTLTAPAVAGSGTLTLPTTTDTVATLTSNTFTTPAIAGGAAFNGATSGAVTIVAPATAGTNTLTLPATTGNILASTSAIGYTTGAGGAVTQTTSKSTAVTLNTLSGQITMNNAALAAGASVSFVVNNTAVASGDMIIVSGAYLTVNPSNYRIETAYIGTTGSFSIRVTNISAGSLSEALVINFALIKGATA